MFRCPNCARVYKMPLSHNYSLLASTNLTCFVVVREPFSADNAAKAFAQMVYEPASLEDAFRYVEQFEPSYRDLGTYTNDTIPCPVCKKSHSWREWQEAFENPMDYFDAEELCPNGHELWMTRMSNGKYALACEECGWVKPGSAVSGSADINIA